MSEERLNELEIRMTHHEALIETLDGIVIEQQRMIDQLKAELAAIRQRLLAAGLSDIAAQAEEKPPPHY